MAVTTEAPARTTFPYLGSLDGIRGLLVFPVVAFHFSVTEWGTDALAPGSFFAPSMFFTLSGFLITSLLLVERERSGGVDWRGFWARRFRRLLPASTAVVLGCAALGLVIDLWDFRAGDAAAGLLSYMNWRSIHFSDDPARLLGPLGPYWSLAVEEQFYLGLSLVVALAFAARRSIATLTAVLVGLWAASVLAQVLVEGSVQREYFGTDTRASEMLAGCLLAVAVHRWGWPTDRRWALLGLGCGALTVAGWLWVHETDAWVTAGGLAAFALVNVGLIVGAVVESPLARVLRFEPLAALGRISYPVYVVHWAVTVALNSDRVGFGGWPLIGLRFVVTIGLGWALARFVEEPVRRKRVLSGRALGAGWALAAVAAVALAGLTDGA